MRPRTLRRSQHVDVGSYQRRPGCLACLTVVGLIGLSGAVAGCSATDDLARAVRPLADDTDTLAQSRWTPPRYTPPRIPPAEEQIVDEAVAIAAPTEGLSPEDRKELVRGACEAVDAVEASGGTEQQAYEYLVTRFPGTYANRVEGEQLVSNLAAANSFVEEATILGRAALCAWASS